MTTIPDGVQAVLFDLDGTLLDTVADLHAAINGMLADVGCPLLPEDTVRRYVGRGVTNLVRRSLWGAAAEESGTASTDKDASLLAVALDRFRCHYAVENGRRAVLYPGVRDGLEAIRGRALPMGVVTNKASEFTRPLLEMTGLMSFFSVVVSGDDLPWHKPSPLPLVWACGRLGVSPANTLFVGDSVNDFLAARAAGCPVALLPYGYNEGRDVRELDENAIVPSILAVAERLRTHLT